MQPIMQTKVETPPTEIIISKYATTEENEDNDNLEIDSTQAVSNQKELKVLYGNGDDVFSPTEIEIKASDLLPMISREHQ